MKNSNELVTSALSATAGVAVMEEALRQSVIDAACDEMCPAELNWSYERCASCPVSFDGPGELYHDTERDIACWMQYYIEEACKALGQKETDSKAMPASEACVVLDENTIAHTIVHLRESELAPWFKSVLISGFEELRILRQAATG